MGAGPLAYPVASAAPVSYAGAYGAYAPAAYAAVAPVPVAPLAHQHHAQDEFGNLAYGYVDHNSAKHEIFGLFQAHLLTFTRFLGIFAVYSPKIEQK